MSAVHPELRRGAGPDDRDRRTLREGAADVKPASNSLGGERLEALRECFGFNESGGHRGKAISHLDRGRQVVAI
jgi:hypothetical protein